MDFQIHTLFPEMFTSFLTSGLIEKAIKKGILNFELINIRDYTLNKHRKVDDTPYGGDAGMLLAVQPLYDSLRKNRKEDSKIIYITPSGELLTQRKIKQLVDDTSSFTLVCGHYEGFDERIFDLHKGERICIGDFICMSGEAAAFSLIEAIARCYDGVISNSSSLEKESFSEGILEYAQFTKPSDIHGLKVPDVLLTGHHMNIEKYRRLDSLYKTFVYRPDLFIKQTLTNEEIDYILSKIE